MIFATIEATVAAQFVSPVAVTYAGEEGKINEVNYTAIDGMTQRKVTERLNEYDDSPIFAIGSLKYIYAASVPAEMITKDLRRVLTPDASQTSETDDTNVGFSVTLLAIDDDRYAELCKSAGVPLGSNLLVNLQRAVIDGKTAEFEPFNFKNQTLELKNYDGTVKNLTLDGELTAGEIPNDVLFELTGDLTVILPETETQSFTWFSDTGNAEGFTEYANTVLAEEIKPDGITDDMIDVLDIRAATEAVRSTYQLIMVFIYGFVGMLTLIGLTNVISTISTNVRSRSREFAVLKSVGMTQKGLKTVLNYESILSSIKSLMYGLPLGIAAAYLIYRFAIYSEVQYRYVFPWLTVLEIVLGVFVITWVTMRYSISRLKEKNIVETIRE
jgi:putative ABC transport system permease protein